MTNAVTSKSPFKKIAAEIRKQARVAAKEQGCGVSVTKSEYAGGRKIYVDINSSQRNHLCPIFRKWQNENPHSSRLDFPNPRGCKERMVHLTNWAIKLIEKLEEIVDQFNWDNSDSMTDYFDVNYYTYVDFCLKLDQDVQHEIDSWLNTHTEEEIEAHFIEAIHDLTYLGVQLPTSQEDSKENVIAEDSAPVAAEQTNVVSVDFAGSGKTEKSESTPIAELRSILAALDKERLELEAKVEEALERRNLEEKIEEQMSCILALKNELKKLS